MVLRGNRREDSRPCREGGPAGSDRIATGLSVSVTAPDTNRFWAGACRVGGRDRSCHGGPGAQGLEPGSGLGIGTRLETGSTAVHPHIPGTAAPAGVSCLIDVGNGVVCSRPRSRCRPVPLDGGAQCLWFQSPVSPERLRS